VSKEGRHSPAPTPLQAADDAREDGHAQENGPEVFGPLVLIISIA
jgi:hypothetical protein